MSAKNMAYTGGTSASIMPQCQKNPLPRRILVAEDEPDIRQFNTEVLTESGYHVDAAEDGEVAWQSLNTGSYDLLITDYDMPKVSGIDLLKRLHAARMALPVIMVSGRMPTEELKRHPWLQIHVALLKPYTIEDLLGTVKEVLRTTNSAREPIALPQNLQSQPSADRLQL
jgi:DNA-binding response OmpR family regulator